MEKKEKKTTRLLLTRHGQTVGNVDQVLQGQMQGELTEEGREQARQVRDRLRTEHIDAFFSSDLKRAIDTCTIIAEPHRLPVQTTPLLRERDWGDFTGELIPDLKDKVWPDNVESIDHMKERAMAFVQLIKDRYPGGTVLAVGHGILNKALQAAFYGKPMHEVLKMTNAEVREIEL
ncbi:MAG: histidine phosphatase family protein [Prevotella sp.]|nr:histidine phosphatase family protein [Prevotella sp.]